MSGAPATEMAHYPRMARKVYGISTATTRTETNYDYEAEKFLGTKQGTTLGGNRRGVGQGKSAGALSATNTSAICSDPGRHDPVANG